MSPPTRHNNNGDSRGRAAPGGMTSRRVARTGEVRVIASALAMLVVPIGVLIAYAPELWPGLFVGA